MKLSQQHRLTGRAARPAASGKTGVSEAAPFIRGRAAIAHALGKSERTITRWLKRGVLPATKEGPFRNSLLRLSAADIDGGAN